MRTGNKKLKRVAALSILVIIFHTDAGFAGEYKPGKIENGKVLIDFSKPPKASRRLLPGLYFGLKSEFSYESEKNFDLNRKKPDDLAVMEPSVSLALSLIPAENISVYTNIEAAYLSYNDEKRKKRSRGRKQLKEAFLRIGNMKGNILLKIGRQRIRDNREWLIDEELDSVRVLYSFYVNSLDISFGRERGGFGGNKKKPPSYYQVSNKIAFGKRDSADLYWFKKSGTPGEELNFYGAGYTGRLKHGLLVRVGYSILRGEDKNVDIRGSALDTGITFKTGLPWKHTFFSGYASASGAGTSGQAADTGFRQTGLQDNNAKISGITRVRYYGEVFDPELANMSIFSISSGVRPAKNFSLEMIFHSFSQNRASEKLRDSGIDENPDGIHRFLGREADIVAGLRFGKKIRTSIVAGRFFPGKAFKKRTEASYLEFKFSWTF